MVEMASLTDDDLDGVSEGRKYPDGDCCPRVLHADRP